MSCPDCFKGSVHDGTPGGSEEVIHGVNTYIASPSEDSAAASALASKSTILFLTDAFGFNLVNSKLLADHYASKIGVRVLVPDIIPGGGVPLYALDLMNSVTAPVGWLNLRGMFWRVVTVVRMMSIFIPFAIRSRGVFPTLLTYARAVKAELPKGGKLGAAGFCWGGLQTTKLSQEAAVAGGEVGLVDAHFTAHPAGLKTGAEFVAGIQKFKVPFSMAIGDADFVLSKEKMAEIEAYLRKELGDDESIHYEVEIYLGCSHGFAVRADPNKTVENDAAEKAAEQAVGFFEKWLA